MFVNVDNKKVLAIAVCRENLPYPKEAIEVRDVPEHSFPGELMWDGKRVILDPDYKPPQDPITIEERISKLENQVKILAKKASGEPLTSEEEAILANV